MIETDVHPVVSDVTSTLPPRHYVERITPSGQVPPAYSDVALCGAKVTEFVQHNGSICQECVDEQRRRGSA